MNDLALSIPEEAATGTASSCLWEAELTKATEQGSGLPLFSKSAIIRVNCIFKLKFNFQTELCVN